MQVPGVDYKESFFPFTTYMSTRILIELTNFHEEEGWVAKLFDAELEFLHRDISVEMFISWPEVIVEVGIITNEFI